MDRSIESFLEKTEHLISKNLFTYEKNFQDPNEALSLIGIYMTEIYNRAGISPEELNVKLDSGRIILNIYNIGYFEGEITMQNLKKICKRLQLLAHSKKFYRETFGE